MSKGQTKNSKKVFQNKVDKLSKKYKTPVRIAISEAEEAILSIITQMIQELATNQIRLDKLNKERLRLIKLLEENNIDYTK